MVKRIFRSFLAALLLHVFVLVSAAYYWRATHFAQLGVQTKQGLFFLDSGIESHSEMIPQMEKSKHEIGSGTTPGMPLVAREAAGRDNGQLDAKVHGNFFLEYPAVSRQLGEQGAVELSFMVSSVGKAEEIVVMHASGYKRLDEAAIRAIREAQFFNGGEILRKKMRVVFDLKGSE